MWTKRTSPEERKAAYSGLLIACLLLLLCHIWS